MIPTAIVVAENNAAGRTRAGLRRAASMPSALVARVAGPAPGSQGSEASPASAARPPAANTGR
jgi:hypothetical protein